MPLTIVLCVFSQQGCSLDATDSIHGENIWSSHASAALEGFGRGIYTLISATRWIITAYPDYHKCISALRFKSLGIGRGRSLCFGAACSLSFGGACSASISTLTWKDCDVIQPGSRIHWFLSVFERYLFLPGFICYPPFA